MPTNRELYFSLIKENNKYLTRLVVKALLNDANGFCDDTSLYKNFDLPVENYDQLVKKIERVKNGEPFQYVLGYANFIDKEFDVNEHVLIPRQETEELVISLKTMIEQIYGDKEINILDVGTGSGAIAISLKRYFPNANVYATDISKEALEVAKKNSKKLGCKVNFLCGDMVEPLFNKDIKFDVLVSNPPYIEKIDEIDEQVFKYEPHLALIAKPCTFFYEKILQNVEKIMKENSIIAFEIGEDMKQPLTDLMADNLTFTNLSFRFSKDMYNKLRFLYIMLEESKEDA